MAQLRSVTCHIGSHSVTCHPTQVNTPRLNPSQASTRFTYPGGMDGWVDLVDLIVPWPWVEPATFRSLVWRRTAAPLRQPRKLDIHAHWLEWVSNSYQKTCTRNLHHGSIPWHSYGVSLAIWDHTVLPATQHKWTHPALTPAMQLYLVQVSVLSNTADQPNHTIFVIDASFLSVCHGYYDQYWPSVKFGFLCCTCNTDGEAFFVPVF